MAAKMPGGRTKATPKKAAGPVKRSGAKASTTGGTATATKRKTKAKTNAARKGATRRGD